MDRDAALGSLLRALRDARKIVLTTHVCPDGDGLGSEVALEALAKRFGATVRVINRDPAPPQLDFLESDGGVEVYDPARHDAWIEAADLVVVMDNSAPARLEEMLAPIRRGRALTATLDHHPDPDPGWDLRVVDETASSTGELVHDLYRLAGVTPSPREARALYVALVSDTGRFRFANTDEAALRLAADLVALGASPSEVHALLDERQPLGYMRLLGEALSSIDPRAGGALVVIRVTEEQLARTGARPGDTSEIINEALRLDGSRVAALFREAGRGRTKVSLRSKGARDVNALARRFGGGGHVNAAGMILEWPLDEAVERLLPDLERLAADGTPGGEARPERGA